MTTTKLNWTFNIDCLHWFAPLQAQFSVLPSDVEDRVMREVVEHGDRMHSEQMRRKLEREKQQKRSRRRVNTSEEDSDSSLDDLVEVLSQQKVKFVNEWAVNPQWYRSLAERLRRENIRVINYRSLFRPRMPRMLGVHDLCRLRSELQQYLLRRNLRQLFHVLQSITVQNVLVQPKLSTIALPRTVHQDGVSTFQWHHKNVLKGTPASDPKEAFGELWVVSSVGRWNKEEKATVSDRLADAFGSKKMREHARLLDELLPHSIKFTFSEWKTHVEPELEKAGMRLYFRPTALELQFQLEQEERPAESEIDESDHEVGYFH